MGRTGGSSWQVGAAAVDSWQSARAVPQPAPCLVFISDCMHHIYPFKHAVCADGYFVSCRRSNSLSSKSKQTAKHQAEIGIPAPSVDASMM